MMKIAKNVPSKQKVQFFSLTSKRWAKWLRSVLREAIPNSRAFIVAGILAMGLAVVPGVAAAQNSSPCAWPYEITPHGAGNWAWPDTTARYWLMPFNSQYTQMTIHGIYPTARYMSFVTYDGYVPTKVDSHIYDAEIQPDKGSGNPFTQPWGNGTYTIKVLRGDSQGTNVITTADGSAWVIYRVYVPDAGQNTMGGVPLPTVTLTEQNGATQTLQACTQVNVYKDLSTVLNDFYQFPGGGNSYVAPDRLWFAPPDVPPPPLVPNPDNKYINAVPGSYQHGRIIVIRGKAPGFPDTYSGGAVWDPKWPFKAVQMRYWSLCVNDAIVPFPAVDCLTDLNARLDRNNYYTAVISDDMQAPSWLPRTVNWLPWGDEQTTKVIFFRNMVPSTNFNYAIQNAIADGCTYHFPYPKAPDVSQVVQAGHCAQAVMGDYYPIGVWCDTAVFRRSGWRGCFRAAGTGSNGLWKNAQDLGNGWKWLSWFGYFKTNSSSWIYHMQLGWLLPYGTSTDSIWFYDSSMNAFLWTSATEYPYVYRAKDEAWLWYKEGTSNPPWFYNFKTGAWENN